MSSKSRGLGVTGVISWGVEMGRITYVILKESITEKESDNREKELMNCCVHHAAVIAGIDLKFSKS